MTGDAQKLQPLNTIIIETLYMTKITFTEYSSGMKNKKNSLRYCIIAKALFVA